MRRIRFELGHSLWSLVRLAVRFFGRDLLLSDEVTLRVLPIARHLDRPESSLIVPPADLRMSGIEHYSQHAVGPQLAVCRPMRTTPAAGDGSRPTADRRDWLLSGVGTSG